jgi:transcriptional regulator GlxA family with amidase domain
MVGKHSTHSLPSHASWVAEIPALAEKLPKESLMTTRIPERLSPVEKEAIAMILAVKSSADTAPQTTLPEMQAQLMHQLILTYHGHVKLRFWPLAKELGVEMRTLQRIFDHKFGKTMLQCQQEVRLEFSQMLLRMIPPTKLSVIANLLGYDEVRDFIRFFRRHTKRTPAVWGRGEGEGLGDEKKS